MPRPGVRPEHEKPVRHPGRGHALVGLAARPAPQVGQALSLAADDGKRRTGDIDLETGGGNDHVGFDFVPVAQAQAVFGKALDAGSFELDVVAGEGGVVVAGEQHPLAADFVVGREFFTQYGILHRRAHIPERELFHAGGQGRIQNHRRAHHAFGNGQNRAPKRGLGKRQTPERGLHQIRQRLVELGQHIGRAALDDGQAFDLGRDRRYHLSGAGAGTDDRHLLAGQGDVVIPARGMHDLAGEILHAGKIRGGRFDQPAHRRDHGTGGVARAVVAGQMPDTACVVELGLRDAHAEMQMGMQPVFVGTALDIGMNLCRPRIGGRPVRILLERVGIQMRGHVAGTAGIGIVAPGAADVVGTFENHEILDAFLLETNTGVDAGKTGADDDYVVGDRAAFTFWGLRHDDVPCQSDTPVDNVPLHAVNISDPFGPRAARD